MPSEKHRASLTGFSNLIFIPSLSDSPLQAAWCLEMDEGERRQRKCELAPINACSAVARRSACGSHASAWEGRLRHSAKGCWDSCINQPVLEASHEDPFSLNREKQNGWKWAVNTRGERENNFVSLLRSSMRKGTYILNKWVTLKTLLFFFCQSLAFQQV